jgi:hypothetical protein
MTEAEKRIAVLEAAIADALAAMDRCEYGTARQILRKGAFKPPIPATGVIGKVDCQR